MTKSWSSRKHLTDEQKRERIREQVKASYERNKEQRSMYQREYYAKMKLALKLMRETCVS